MKLSLIRKKIWWTVERYIYLYTGVIFFKGHFSLKKYWNLRRDRKELLKQAQESDIEFPVAKLWPCYMDKEDDAGTLPLHYFFQDLFVAQRIYLNSPERHVDIGSRIDGFVAHIASFRKVEVFDIRPLDTAIPNVIFKQLNLMDKDSIEKESIPSISCLHALEHFGLGRYGDPINFEGFKIGFDNITDLLQKKGKFYFSVPIGFHRIEFHAHRVFSLSFLLKMISIHFDIDMFSYVDDQNNFYSNIKLEEEMIENNYNCKYGCGIFELTKR